MSQFGIRVSILAVTLLRVAPLHAQDDLPKHASGEVLDFEPKLMLDGPRATFAAPSPVSSAEGRIRELEDALIQAEKRSVDSEQLFKEGILAKVEVEGRALRVVQVRKELADARLSVAAARADAVKKSFDSNAASQPDLDAAEAALKTARESAAAASAEWDKGQLDAANLDLKRKRKLYAEDVSTRREVQMAEDRVVLLSGTAAKP